MLFRILNKSVMSLTFFNIYFQNAGADVSFGSTATVLDSQGTPSTIPEETSAASNQSASESIINYAVRGLFIKLHQMAIFF